MATSRACICMQIRTFSFDLARDVHVSQTRINIIQPAQRPRCLSLSLCVKTNSMCT